MLFVVVGVVVIFGLLFGCGCVFDGGGLVGWFVVWRCWFGYLFDWYVVVRDGGVVIVVG